MDTAVIRSWAEHDPDPATREQILTWLKEHNTAAGPTLSVDLLQ